MLFTGKMLNIRLQAKCNLGREVESLVFCSVSPKILPEII